MPHNAPPTPFCVDSALKGINGDIRKFARLLEKAKAARSAGEQEAYLRELGDSKKTLQQHRANLRQRIAALGAKGVGRDKLGAARTSIEQELRKLNELEKKVEAGPSRPPPPCAGSAPTTSPGSPPGSPDSQDSQAQARGREAATAQDAPPEVKVLKCQLLRQADDEEITKEFVCKICLDVVGAAPKLTRCAHLFCGDCIKQWFDVQPGMQTWAGRAQAAGSVPCPVCKEPLCERADLHDVCPGQRGNSAFLWKMLSSLEVRCANHPACKPGGRCDWTGTYGSFQAHIRACANVPLRPSAGDDEPSAPAEVRPGQRGSGGHPDGFGHTTGHAAPPADLEEQHAEADGTGAADDAGGARGLHEGRGGCEDVCANDEGGAEAADEDEGVLDADDADHADHADVADDADDADDAASDLDVPSLVDGAVLGFQDLQAAPPVEHEAQPMQVEQDPAALAAWAAQQAALAACPAQRAAPPAEPPAEPPVGLSTELLAAQAAQQKKAKQQKKQAKANQLALAAQLAAAAAAQEAQCQAYVQQVAQWRAAQAAAHQMAYTVRCQAAAQQWQAAYAAQWQAACAASAARARASLGGR